MLTPISAQTSYAASPLLEDIDNQDRRVEIAAARETALNTALANRGKASTPDDIVKEAALFEAFLADHPATGAKSLTAAFGLARMTGDLHTDFIIGTAAKFAAFLENGLPDAA